jgi:hypothetical protein
MTYRQSDDHAARVEHAGLVLATRIGRTRVRIAMTILLLGFATGAAIVALFVQTIRFASTGGWVTVAGAGATPLLLALANAERLAIALVGPRIDRWTTEIAREHGLEPSELATWASPRIAAPRAAKRP